METCCAIFGHRDIICDKEFLSRLQEYIEMLIKKENVKTFIFGSNSKFYRYCWEVIEDLKQKYSTIKTVVIDCLNEHSLNKLDIDDFMQKEKIIYYDEVLKMENDTGKYSYIKRNYKMIDVSDIVLFYYDKNYEPKTRTKSGTGIAYKYALQRNKRIYNFFNPLTQEYNQH